jgi:hypothetical protein
MNAIEASRHLKLAEARFSRANRRLKYLRDGELLGFHSEELYRAALADYRSAQQALLAARYVAAVVRPELLAA